MVLKSPSGERFSSENGKKKEALPAEKAVLNEALRSGRHKFREALRLVGNRHRPEGGALRSGRGESIFPDGKGEGSASENGARK